MRPRCEHHRSHRRPRTCSGGPSACRPRSEHHGSPRSAAPSCDGSRPGALRTVAQPPHPRVLPVQFGVQDPVSVQAAAGVWHLDGHCTGERVCAQASYVQDDVVRRVGPRLRHGAMTRLVCTKTTRPRTRHKDDSWSL
ncbi:hypothetical protein PYCCODRAFT_1198269 [Trametes coccinea BRFM310]|uniref:Uncharacterized protein n=1 Tax=Trametes coccinea (strain BRFM310) TaxID=1353009 RepID=A0A1Y2I7G1_TRAC3|nr:hypothetical protein PYCCODRAFT_1198269 [Trametes coccinea BRFM310]